MSTIIDSNNVDAQDQILPTHGFHSLFQKMNNERLTFYDIMFMKKQNPNEPLHLLITKGASACKKIMLMFLIEGLLCFYNKHFNHIHFLYKKDYSWCTLIFFNGTIIDSNIYIHFNCQYLAFLHLEWLDNLITKYDQLQLMVPR